MAAQAVLSRDAEEFLSYLTVERGRAPASISAYRRDLLAYERFLSDRGVTVLEADVGLIEAYVALLSETRRASSTARALAAVRGLHRFCVDERGATLDPTEGVSTPRIPQAIPKALSEAEVELLLSAVIGEDPRALRNRAILETLYATGMRISELAGLRLGDLDTGRGLAVVYGKGSKERLVPIGRQAVLALDAWLGSAGRNAMAPAALGATGRRGSGVHLDAWQAHVTPGRVAGRQGCRREGQARGPGVAARPAALMCHTLVGARRGHTRGAGAARARDHHDDAGLHEGLTRAAAARLRTCPSQSTGHTCRQRRSGRYRAALRHSDTLRAVSAASAAAAL